MIDQKVHRAIVIGLGREGEMALQAFHERLRRRYDSIPTIGSLLITDQAAADPDASAPVELLAGGSAATPTHFRRLVVDTGGLNPAELNSISDISSWFHAQGDTVSLQDCRVSGRLALFKHVNEIRDCVNELLTEITSARSEALLHDLKLSLYQQKEIDLVIVGSLGNPFASGMFMDLAYLLQYIATESRPEDLFIFLHGVLLLPGFEDEFAGIDVDANARQSMRSRAEANAYAALKEIDYYMSGHQYRCEYRREGESDSLTVEQLANQSPFNDGFLYLITATNEANRSIARLTDATSMAAEWLVSALVTPMHIGLRSISSEPHMLRYDDKVGVYGSFGLACWHIPLGDLKEYCTRRMTLQLVRDCLLAPPPVHEILRSDLEQLRAASHLSLGDFEQMLDARHEADGVIPDFELRPVNFDIIRPYAHRELETELIKAQDKQLRQVLPDIKARMQRNSEKLRDNIADSLEQQARALLDHEPAGSVRRVAAIFGLLQTEIAEERRKLEREISAIDSSMEQKNRSIERARGRYFSAAQAFGAPPFLPVLGSILLLILLFYFTWETIGNRLGEPWLALASIGAGALAFLVISLAAYIHLTTARQQYIKLYADRLQLFRKQAKLARLASVYDDFGALCTDVQDQVANFQAKLEAVQAEADREFNAPAWPDLLFGASRFILEESVIKPEDVEAIYAEVAKQELRFDLHEIVRATTAFHNWQGLTVGKIRQRLREYAQMRSKQAESHQALEYLNRLPDDTLRDRAYRLASNSLPFWQCDIVHLTPPAADPQRMLGIMAEAERSSLAIRAVEAYEKSFTIVGTADPHRVTSIGLRRNIPLFSVTQVRRMRSAYDAIRGAGGVGELHVTSGNIALPDLMRDRQAQPVIDSLSGLVYEPRLVFALANALGRLAQDSDRNYYFEYVSQIDQMLALSAPQSSKTAIPALKASLGRTKAEACLSLYTNPEYFDILTRELASPEYQTGKKVQPRTRVLHGRAQALHDYLTREAATGELQDWEKIELEQYRDAILRQLGQQMPEAKRPRHRMITGAAAEDKVTAPYEWADGRK